MFSNKYKHQASVKSVRDKITQIDSLDIQPIKDEIRLFAIARNESLRLPYFLSYYTRLGVDRIFLLDNGSTDSTEEIVLAFNAIPVHLFRINEAYKEHWDWMEFFLKEYGLNFWCVVVDIDELFSYPKVEQVKLKKLAEYLTVNGYGAVRSLLLDLYSDKSLSDVNYISGSDPLEVNDYFDVEFDQEIVFLFDKNKWEPFPTVVYVGGMRERVFRSNLPTTVQQSFKRLPYHLSKISFFYNQQETYLTQGMHAINGSKIADIEGIVFHTKFMQDFVQEVNEEVVRGEHFGSAVLYKIFQFTTTRNPYVNFLYPGSKKLVGVEQLINLGLMKSSASYEAFISNL